jgi:hypothetical protein
MAGKVALSDEARTNRTPLISLAAGIAHPASHGAGAAELVSNLLVGLLIIGIVRAWELVGDRATDIISSIAVLTGQDHKPDGPLQHPRPPIRPRPNQLAPAGQAILAASSAASSRLIPWTRPRSPHIGRSLLVT